MYNLGLLRRQEQEEIFAGVLFLAGVILLGFASLIPSEEKPRRAVPRRRRGHGVPISGCRRRGTNRQEESGDPLDFLNRN